jgi:hypothetical protein
MMFAKKLIVLASFAVLSVVGVGVFLPASASAASSCQKGSFLGLPTWYEYLEFDPKDCSIVEGQSIEVMAPRIGLAVVEILIRISGMVAVGYIIYGGFRYMLSQGEPDATKKAKGTILNAIIGMIIAITATFAVTLVGNIL